MNLADLPPTRGLPMFDDPRPPLAGERRKDMPRSAIGPTPLPLGAVDPAPVLSAIDRHLALARRTGQHLAVLAVRMEPPPWLDGDGVEGLTQAFGQRLRSRVRATDTVLWQGGGEHVALLLPCRHVGAMSARQRLLGVLGETYWLDSGSVSASARIGCACYPTAGDTAAVLLAAAMAGR